MKGRVGGQKKFRTDDDGTMDYSRDYSNYKLPVVHRCMNSSSATSYKDSRRKGP